MLTALAVLVFNISAHCTGHLGQLVHVQCNDPAGKLKKKLKKMISSLADQGA